MVENDPPDKSVDLQCLDVVQGLDGLLDLTLVGLTVDEEDKCVLFFNLLHCSVISKAKEAISVSCYFKLRPYFLLFKCSDTEEENETRRKRLDSRLGIQRN